MATKKHTILIVEDEVSLRSALKTKLTKEGYKVLEAANGQEGLSIALENNPNLILLDIIMPIMDGITMLTKLRQDKRGEDIKVIMLTNLSDPHKEMVAEQNKVVSFLIKTNWKLEDLMKVIHKILI